MITPVLPVYRRSQYTIVRGEGVYLFDSEGRRFLDFAAGIAVNSLGHCHPHAVEALKKQAETVWHTSNLYQLPGQKRMAERLVERTFADTVFFTNSGAEAVECGIKMVRKYHHAKGSDRYRIVTVQGAFHGRTLATIAAGGNPKYTQGFEPIVEGFDHVPFGDIDALERAVGPQTAGILLEPIQGEGGIREFGDAYLRKARELADTHGILLFLDEVQCGMGRTGTLFAYERAGIAPDIVAVAKGIGTGFPFGACLATENAASGMTPGSHGSTYGGNPLAMAVGNAVLDVILAPGFLQDVAQTGAYLRDELRALCHKHPQHLSEVRGRGLLLGLVIRVSNGEMVERLRANGMMTVPAGEDVVRILPPLIVTRAHVDEAIGILDKTCNEWLIS